MFPETLLEFDRFFATDQACLEYLEKIRWPDGFLCPACPGKRAWKTGRLTYFCCDCKRQTSVLAGTIFHRTKQPLRLWFKAAWLMTGDKNGMSALGIKRQLGIRRYETAWSMLQKLRRATVRPDRDMLSGEVEVDEALLGGRRLARGRSKERAMVAIAAEVDGNKIGRIRMRHIESATGRALESFVTENIEKSSVVVTDGLAAYSGLGFLGYSHKPIKGYTMSDDDLLPRVNKVTSLLKRWLLGVHHGGVGHKHLQRYLDEFTFRFNRRTSTFRGQLFERLIGQALTTPATHKA